MCALCLPPARNGRTLTAAALQPCYARSPGTFQCGSTHHTARPGVGGGRAVALDCGRVTAMLRAVARGRRLQRRLTT
jgi:hypothetical protein